MEDPEACLPNRPKLPLILPDFRAKNLEIPAQRWVSFESFKGETMKHILFAICLMFSSFALALDLPGYTKAPEEKINDYRKALWASFAKNPDTVNGCDSRWLQTTMDFVSEVWVNSTSAQPLLVTSSFYQGGNLMHRLVIVTTPDLKTVTQVFAEIYEMGEVNKGDLANPIIVDDYVIKGKWSCARKTGN